VIQIRWMKLHNIYCVGLIILFATSNNINFAQNKLFYTDLHIINQNIDTSRLRILIDKAEHYISKNTDSAVKYSRIAIREAEKTNQAYFIAEAYNSMAYIYYYIEKNDSSIYYFINSLLIYEKLGNTYKTAKSMLSVAEAYRAFFNCAKSIEYAHNALNYIKTNKITSLYGKAYNRLSAIYYEKHYSDTTEINSYEKKILVLSKKYADSSLIYAVRENNFELQANNYNILGAIESSFKRYRKAKELYFNSLKVYLTLNDSIEIFSVMLNLSQNYRRLSNFKEAEYYGKQSLELAEKTKIKRFLHTAHRFMYELYYENLHDYKKAIYHLENSNIYLFESYSQKNNENIAELESRFKSKQQQNEIQALKKDVDFKNKQNLYLYIVILLIIFVIIFLFVIIRLRYQNITKNEKILDNEVKMKQLEVERLKLELEVNELKNKELISDIQIKDKFANELKEINETKDKFFSIIAHDLRSPFNILIGFSELLSDNNVIKANTDALKLTKYMNSSAKQAYLLLDNLLIWARSQSGNFDFHPTRIRISELLEQAIETVQFSAQNKNIEILYKNGFMNFAYADRNMIEAVIRNLLGNAIKFTPRNGVITIDSKLENKYCVVSIRDTGVGISPERQKKLFKINEKVHTLGTESESGTGLGLLLCNEFVTKNGGTIRVESTQGNGSTFSFTIPIIQ
jgi:signal transduction histidine kinase